jgi:hypothetical protein
VPLRVDANKSLVAIEDELVSEGIAVIRVTDVDVTLFVRLVVDVILSVQLVVDVASFVSAAGIVVDVTSFFESVVDVTLLVNVVVTGLLVGFRELVVDSTLLVRLAIPVDNVVKLSPSRLVAVSDKPIPASVCSNNLVDEADRLVDSVALVKPALVAFGSKGPPV